MLFLNMVCLTVAMPTAPAPPLPTALASAYLRTEVRSDVIFVPASAAPSASLPSISATPSASLPSISAAEVAKLNPESPEFQPVKPKSSAKPLYVPPAKRSEQKNWRDKPDLPKDPAKPIAKENDASFASIQKRVEAIVEPGPKALLNRGVSLNTASNPPEFKIPPSSADHVGIEDQSFRSRQLFPPVSEALSGLPNVSGGFHDQRDNVRN
jgi:hypothetical protein